MRAQSVFFHVIILGTIIGTAALGVWQLQRREWKHDMLARLETSYRSAPKPLPPLAQTNSNDLNYAHKIVTGDCAAKNILLQPGRYYQGQAGYHIFCTVQNSAGANLLVQLGWADAKFNPENLNSKLHFNGTALLLPFMPPPWWLPQTNVSHETLWPMPPTSPAYPVYAILDAQNGKVLLGTDIIPTGERPELPDDHLQYAITWFALAGVLLALYIYRIWSQKPSAQNYPPGKFQGQLLIAMPGMPDPRFTGTVCLVCYHNTEGTMAVILNRLVGTVDARQIMRDLRSDIKLQPEVLRVHFGGPVMGDRGFIVHGSELDHLDSQQVTADVAVSATTDVLLRLIPHQRVPWRLVLGCASWIPGQLEDEIRGGAWLTAPATRSLIFQPELANLWPDALRSIGIRQPAMLVTDTGHA